MLRPVPIYKSLPQIPQSFIELFVSEYNKGSVITDAMVEYEEGLNKPLHESLRSSSHLIFKRLKINPDNTINIKTIKNSWNKEEHIADLFKVWKHLRLHFRSTDEETMKKEFNEWIKENL